MISKSTTDNKETTLRWKKYSREFSKYTTVGIAATFSNIFLMWLLIDVLKINTLLSSSLVVTGIFISKFKAYCRVNLIREQFVKYAIVQGIMRLLQIAGVWYLIDILKLPTVFSAAFVMASIFVLTFMVFKITKLTTN